MAGTTHLVGRSMGRYQIQAIIGSGGFATVYRAVDAALERPVALKVVDPTAHRNPTIGRRFLLEGRAVASLDHPAIVPVYDAGEHDGVLWLAMRLIEGGSLDQALAGGRRFSAEETLALAERIGAALDHAHGKGVVHRDVKPSNILLEDNDPARAWLTDFGIAATARTVGLYTTGALGTAAYMAPEQARPSEVGPPADLYSLACVVYELVAGRRPFPGEDHVALLLAHATAAVPPTGDAAFDQLMARALAKPPGPRPTSGAALTQELRTALAGRDGKPAIEDAPLTTPAQFDPAPTEVGSTRPGKAAAPAPPHVDPAPTVVDRRDATAVYPVVSRPAPPAGPPGRPPPPPLPGFHPGGLPPVHDPTVVRFGRRRARRRLLAGAVVLVVGVGAAVVAIVELNRRVPTNTVTDSAGVSYEVPTSWSRQVDPPLVTWQEGDAVVATVTHAATGASDAATALLDADPARCSDENSVVTVSVTGADAAARCDNPDAEVLGAIVDGELWIVTVATSVRTEEQDVFLDSFDFGR